MVTYLLLKTLKNLKEKKKADEMYSELAAKLAILASDNNDIHKLNEEMALLDSDELDKAENTLGNLVKENQTNVLDFFTNIYSPIRNKQAANFKKLKILAISHSQFLVENINKEKKNDAILTIIFVLAGTFIGSIILFYTNLFIIRSAKNVFSSIYSLSDQLAGTAEELSNKSRDLSEATTEEASAIQETASSLHEVTAMVQRNTDNATKSRELSKVSREASHNGLDSVNKMMVAMEEINQTQGDIIAKVDEGNKKIGDIVGLISAIGEKTKVINDIVFQTKLLSFNASVEAARAGEQGKGFAVVADEVGKLAQMSGKASQEITNMLEESIKKVSSIISETKTNVELIVHSGKDKITQGNIIARSCANSFQNVVSKIEEVDRTIDDISVASKEQAQGISEINKAVGQLDLMTQENSIIANQTFESSKVLTDKSNELRKMVDHLVVIFK